MAMIFLMVQVDVRTYKRKNISKVWTTKKNQVAKDHIPSLLALKDNVWTRWTYSFFPGMYVIFAFIKKLGC